MKTEVGLPVWFNDLFIEVLDERKTIQSSLLSLRLLLPLFAESQCTMPEG